MTRQRKQPERGRAKKKKGPGLLTLLVQAAGRTIARHPSLAGGGAAFIVAFTFVAANAIWYQPGGHPAPFMATRTEFTPPAPVERQVAEAQEATETEPALVASVEAPAESRTVEDILTTVPTYRVPTTEIARPDSETPTASIPDVEDIIAANSAVEEAGSGEEGGDRLVLALQRELQRLGLYDGALDGMSGPKTRQALGAYGERAGLAAAPEISEQTLVRLRIANVESVARPVARPAAEEAEEQGSRGDALPVQQVAMRVDRIPPAAIPNAPSAPPQLVRQIQQGLANIAYADVAVDGVMGSETREAIRHFEAHYRMPETGQASDAVLAKLQEIGAL